MSRYLNVSKENGLHPTAKAVGIRPNEFIKCNILQSGGKYCSKKCFHLSLKGKTHKERMGDRKAEKTRSILKDRQEDKNPNWKGENVSYGALHDFVRSRKSKPIFVKDVKNDKRMTLQTKVENTNEI